MDLLNKGLYTPAEAAYYGEVSFGSVYRWLYPTKKTRPVMDPELGIHERVVTFLDFVQLYIVDRATRRGIRLPKIRKAIDIAEKGGKDHPLARREVVAVFDREMHTGDNEQALEQFTGRSRGQMLLPQIARPFLDRIDFNQEGRAQRFRLHVAYGRSVWMDPRYEFGAPLVGTTATPFYVLANAAIAEGSVHRAAMAYSVEEDDIQIALELHRRLENAA